MNLTEKADDVPKPRPARWKRIVRRTVYVKIGLILALLILSGAAYTRLVFGPVSLASFSGRVEAALEARLGPGWDIDLGQTAVELQANRPVLRADGLVIRNPAGLTMVRAPYAAVTIDPLSLLTGNLAPREIELRDLQVRAQIAADGTLVFVPSNDVPPPSASVAPEGGGDPPGRDAAAPADASVVGRAASSLLRMVLSPNNIVGALDRASITGARLTLVGADNRERVAFSRLDATFARAAEGARSLALSFEGPRGSWQVSGEARQQGGERRADLQASQVPLGDMMLLAGFSAASIGSDLKLSGRLTAASSDDKLSVLEGTFESSAGQLSIPGQKPLRVDRLSGEAAWMEAERRLLLREIRGKSGEAELQLSGELGATGQDGEWQVKLSGRDAVFPRATERDEPVKIAEVAAEARLTPQAMVLDRLALKGQDVDVSLRGSTVPAIDGIGIRGVVEATDTGVRRLLSLWPEGVNPELRGYLGENLVGGTLKRMELSTDLDAQDFEKAFSGRPISDKALKLSFEVADGKLNVIDGLPQLRRLDINGAATGTSTTLTARHGRVEMPDGRRLTFSDGSYRQVNEHAPGSMAQIAFKLAGGADALASFLRSPIFREVGSFDIDPAKIKGRAELNVALPLDVHSIPSLGNMPVNVSGVLSDIAVDQIAGREKLESGQFAVSYQNGALSVRGDGKLGGSPATFDLRQPRQAPGEVLVNLTLDDAARARRSLPSAPQVVGAVPVKITAPFGPGAKGASRFEVDLSKASIDGLLPGWSKPAGRPSKAAFSLSESHGFELRDIALESGPVQVKGTATFSPEGALEKAELGVFKMSPGDDLRAQVERGGAGYRVNLRGNVGDARPILKWVSAPPAANGSGRAREATSIDVDAAINIVTGFNDETLTGVVAKIGANGRDLRALQLRGQFRSATVDAQLVREGGQPQLLLRSGDAGSTLRFLDLYKRMVGGEVQVQTTIGDAVQAGTIAISSFGLRNEPALRSIASQSVDQGGNDDRSSPIKRLESDQVDFTKLEAGFRRSGSRVEYKDVVIWGSQVGFTLSGFVDYARDRMDILGTFVPAYGLNNAFSQVPVVGLLLGGGNKNEGLFAIDFKVSGQASAPTLSVNPLSAVAPGILRKLFGWMLQEDEETSATAPQLPAAPQRRAPRSRVQ